MRWRGSVPLLRWKSSPRMEMQRRFKRSSSNFSKRSVSHALTVSLRATTYSFSKKHERSYTPVPLQAKRRTDLTCDEEAWFRGGEVEWRWGQNRGGRDNRSGTSK